MPAVAVRSLSKPDDLTNPLPELLQTPCGLAIVEIQGSINAPPDAEIGSIVFPDTASGKMKPVQLYVGRFQRMTGEIKKLPKPLAVLRKSGDGLEVMDVVTHKILFAQRPEPVGE